MTIFSLAIAIPTQAKKAPPATWQVMRNLDPVTGAASCAVVASDRAAGMSFTRTGMLYPVVEMNSELGLLVGVSSGGKFRVPTGDIVWRVDQLPFREIRAMDNPAAVNASPDPTGIVEMTAYTMRFVASATATSTLAGGAKAREMLDEMLAGQGLLFRQKAATAQFGIPSAEVNSVGQITAKGLRPIPLDGTFRDALKACGVPG